MSEVLDAVRKKYPAYQSIPDDQLTLKLGQHYPEYLAHPDFKAEFDKASSSGLVEPGNIDLQNRPRVKNPDGTTSTVRSIGINVDGQEVLIPTVSDDGKVLSNDDAVALYKRTGKHLGKFKDAASSEHYAQQLHEQQADLIKEGSETVSPEEMARIERVSDLAAKAKQPARERRLQHDLDAVGTVSDAAVKPLVNIARGVSPQELSDAGQVIENTTIGDWIKMVFTPNDPALQEKLGSIQSRSPDKIEQSLAGIQQSVADNVNFFTSPLGIATLGTGALPATAQRIIAGTFVATMAKSAPEKVTELAEALVDKDTERTAKALTDLGLTGYFIKQGGKATVHGGPVFPTPYKFREASERLSLEHLEQDVPRREQFAQLVPGSQQVPLQPGQPALGERGPIEPPPTQPAPPLTLTALPAAQPATDEQKQAAAVGPATEAAVREQPTTGENDALQVKSPNEGVLREERSGVELPRVGTQDQESQGAPGTQAQAQEAPELTPEDIVRLMTPRTPGQGDEIGAPNIYDIRAQRNVEAINKWDNMRTHEKIEVLSKGLDDVLDKLNRTSTQLADNPSPFLRDALRKQSAKYDTLLGKLIDEQYQQNPNAALDLLESATDGYARQLIKIRRGLFDQERVLNDLTSKAMGAAAEPHLQRMADLIRQGKATEQFIREGFERFASQYERLTGSERSPLPDQPKFEPPFRASVQGMFDRSGEMDWRDTRPTIGDILAKRLQDRLDRARFGGITRRARPQGVRGGIQSVGVEEVIGTHHVAQAELSRSELEAMANLPESKLQFAREGSIPPLKTYAPAIRLADGTIVFSKEIPKRFTDEELLANPKIEHEEVLGLLKELGFRHQVNRFQRGWLNPAGKFLANIKPSRTRRKQMDLPLHEGEPIARQPITFTITEEGDRDAGHFVARDPNGNVLASGFDRSRVEREATRLTQPTRDEGEGGGTTRTPPSTHGMFDKEGEAQGTAGVSVPTAGDVRRDKGIAASARQKLANKRMFGSEDGMIINLGSKQKGARESHYKIAEFFNMDDFHDTPKYDRKYAIYDNNGSQVAWVKFDEFEPGKLIAQVDDMLKDVKHQNMVVQPVHFGLPNARNLVSLLSETIKRDMPRIKEAHLAAYDQPIPLLPGESMWFKQFGPFTSESGAVTIPPAMRSAANALSKAWEDLRNFASAGVATGKELKATIKSQGPKNIAAALMDAAENKARIYGRRVQTAIIADVPDLQDRRALTFIMETMKGGGEEGGTPNLPGLGRIADKAMLDTELARLGDKPRAKVAVEAINHAKANWDRLLPLAEQIAKRIDQQREFERSNHISYDPSMGGYVQHAYDMDAMMGPGRPWIIGSPAGGGGRGGSFKSQELFKTYADAIDKGYHPRTLDIAALTGNRIAIGNRLVNRRNWVEPLKKEIDPTDKRPVVVNLDENPDTTGDYQKVRILPFLEVNVHPRYAGVIDALVGRSRVAKSTPGLVALKTEAYIKHSILGFDSFHVGRIVRKMFFLTGQLPVGRVKPFTNILPSFVKGLSVLDMDDSTLQKYVDKGEMPQKIIDYVHENRPIAEGLIEQGLNVGRIQEALYADTVRAIPILGRFNQWTFESLTRSAMMEAGIIEYKRLEKSKPNLTPEQRSRIIARDLNFYFGNIGRQGVFKNQTYRDMLRIPFLAPQWVESMAQTELRALGQAGKAIGGAFKGSLAVGSLAKGAGTGLAAYVAATQLLNLAFRGHFTWDNPEEDHRFDAWLPDITGDHPSGIFMSPLNNQAEMSYDYIREFENADDSKLLDPIGRIINNKGSPEMRAIYTLITGNVAGTHEKLSGTWDRVIEAAYAFTPVPMNIQPLLPMIGVKHGDYPGRLMKQVMGSTGERVVAARDAEGEVAKLAREFNTKSGVKKSSIITPYKDAPYHVLKMSLRGGNEEKIEEALRKITKDGGTTLDKVGQEMVKWATHPFTGSQEREGAFVASLNPEQRQMYQQAMKDKLSTLRAFSRAYGTVAAEQGRR